MAMAPQPAENGYLGFENSENGDIDEDSEDDQRRSCCASPAPVAHRETPRFSNVGLIGEMSHDGAEHVTDEVFNAASHLMGGMLSVLGSAVLITGAAANSNPWGVISFSLYGASLMFLFFASFAHHAIKGPKPLMDLLRTLDYVAIYFLIPGTMVPVCFVCLHDTWVGWVFFGTTWGIALLGVWFQSFCPLEFPMWASMTMYVTLGWFGAFLAIPAYKCITFEGALLLLLGGLSYTFGGVIFTMQCPNPIKGKFGFHEIWHVFVLAGAAFHYACMLFYVFPHVNRGCRASRGSGRWVHDASATVRRMGSVWSHLWEPQCGQGHSLLGGDDESSLNARYDMDLFPQKIGEGQFSKAYVCWSKEDSSQRYALKVFTPDEGAEHASNEIRVLLLLGQHPRIIRLVDLHNEESRNMRLVLELCAGGQLFDRLVSRGRYKAAKAACVVQEILEALAYMHGKGVMHRDLKPENILLVSPVSDIDIKVCDFGIAKMAERSDGSVVRSARVIQSRPWPQSWPRSTSFKGSDFYLAPEMLRQEEYGPEIDLWSLGVTTFSLISGSLPFVGEGGAEDLRGTYSKIVHRDIKFDGQAWEEAPPTAADFILQLLSLGPAQRPSAAQALSHGFVKSALESFVDSDDEENSEEEEEDESDLQLDELEYSVTESQTRIPLGNPLSNDGLAAMSQRRAVYAAKFLRPPSWTKRLLLREKPRVLTGAGTAKVVLLEKARQFAELPPPRRIPALQRRLDFLLSDAAVKQQLAAPLRPGLSPYFVEFQCWSRQLREIRRVYRAQYLQKLAEVTEVERAREAELYQKERQQRQERREANMQRIGEDMKRRAILRDRKRIESKVNEARFFTGEVRVWDGLGELVPLVQAMVYGLMIHSVDSSQTLHFSIFYTPEGNNTYKKTRQQTIMRRILEEHLFQTHSGDQHTVVKSKVSSLDDADWLFRFSSDAKPAAYKAQAGFDYTEGILRLQASSLFEYPKLVVWKHVDKVVYTLICEPLDNPLLASSFLTLFVHELSDHFRKAGSLVDEVSARPDEVLAILNFMLPGGQLLFVNSNLHRFNKSQITQVLSQKA
eukprot:s1736_g9.t2